MNDLCDLENEVKVIVGPTGHKTLIRTFGHINIMSVGLILFEK